MGGSDVTGLLGFSATHTNERYQHMRSTGENADENSPEGGGEPLSSDEDTSDELEQAINTEPAVADSKGNVKLQHVGLTQRGLTLKPKTCATPHSSAWPHAHGN